MIKVRIFLILIGVFFIGAHLAYGMSEGQVRGTFLEANTAYQQGQYDQAISLGEEILKGGIVSANVYYNLGNAYFKKQILGKAMVNYLRVLQIEPHHKDAKINLRLVKELLGHVDDKKMTHERTFLRRIFHTINGYSYDTLKKITAFFFIFLGVFILFAYWRRVPTIWLMIGSLFLLLGWLSFSFLHEHKLTQQKDRAVCIQTTDAKFEPLEQGTFYFKLMEGTDVKVLRQKDGWSKIKRLDEKIGWVLSETVEKL